MAKKETNTKKENNKNKKSFFKGFKAELKKVNWPTPKQLVNNTAAVLAIVFITTAIVFVLDIAFESMNKHGIERVKSVISTENTTNNEENQATGQEENTATEENANGETTTETNEGQENQTNTENVAE